MRCIRVAHGKWNVCASDYTVAGLSIWKWIWYVNIWTWKYPVLIKCKYNYTATASKWVQSGPTSQTSSYSYRAGHIASTRRRPEYPNTGTNMNRTAHDYLHRTSYTKSQRSWMQISKCSRRHSKTIRNLNGASELAHLRLVLRIILIYGRHLSGDVDNDGRLVCNYYISWVHDRKLNWISKWFFVLTRTFGSEVNCLRLPRVTATRASRKKRDRESE